MKSEQQPHIQRLLKLDDHIWLISSVPIKEGSDWLAPSTPCYISGSLILDEEGNTAYREGKKLPLGKAEFEMLRYLIVSAPRCCTRDNLLKIAEQRYAHLLKDNTLSKHINRIRKKLGSDQGRSFIQTRHSFGYVWRQPVFKAWISRVSMTQNLIEDCEKAGIPLSRGDRMEIEKRIRNTDAVLSEFQKALSESDDPETAEDSDSLR